MATAVQPSSEQQTPNPRTKLVIASLAGAVLVVVGLAVALFAVPYVIDLVFPPPAAGQPDPFRITRGALVWTLELVAVIGFVVLSVRLAGANPPRGLRGGVFVALAMLLAIFFVTRWVGLNLEDSNIGLPITLVTLGVLLGLAYYGLTSPRVERTMHAIDDQGWFNTFHYKPSQGRRMRRLTQIGILIIGGTGVWTLYQHQNLGVGDWKVRIPFTAFEFTALNDIEYTVPVLLAALTLWVAWRAVNVPVFADFLVAADAEMNKVSWSGRKRLVQDTIVVLSTVFLMTAFLFAVDWFWGTVLSWKPIGVLPPASEKAPSFNATEGRKVDW